MIKNNLLKKKKKRNQAFFLNGFFFFFLRLYAGYLNTFTPFRRQVHGSVIRTFSSAVCSIPCRGPFLYDVDRQWQKMIPRRLQLYSISLGEPLTFYLSNSYLSERSPLQLTPFRNLTDFYLPFPAVFDFWETKVQASLLSGFCQRPSLHYNSEAMLFGHTCVSFGNLLRNAFCESSCFICCHDNGNFALQTIFNCSSLTSIIWVSLLSYIRWFSLSDTNVVKWGVVLSKLSYRNITLNLGLNLKLVTRLS